MIRAPHFPSGARGGIDSDARLINRTLLGFILSLLVFGLFVSRLNFPKIAADLAVIVVSPDVLINDYFAHAGMGAAFINSGLCSLAGFGLLRLSGVLVSGPAIAAVFTIAGFALFGKNIYNIWPVMAGIALHARLSRRPFKEMVIVALFGTSLAPIVSEFTFSLGIAFPLNVAAGMIAGLAAGLALPPIARNALDFTRGYNLYNIGFAAGFVGTVTMSVLRALEIEISDTLAWGSVDWRSITPYLAIYFASMIALGILEDRRWHEGLRRIFASSGRLVCDYPRSAGYGATFVNMGLMGFLGIAYVFAVGGDWNGPVIGGILALVGFSAFGKHPLNALPPMIGVVIAANLTSYGMASPTSQIAGLFVATLAPISGAYGPLAGIVAGMLHLVIVVNVGMLHGGLNLYNNGFSGGMTAGILVPVLDWIKERRNRES